MTNNASGSPEVRKSGSPGNHQGSALILGCGEVGVRVGGILLAQDWQVVGVRRTPDPAFDPGFPILAGDIADSACHDRVAEVIAAPDAVLIAATPGLRRGRDHGLLAAAEVAVRRYASARLVLTSTTAVYGDAGGAAVDEHGPIATTSAAAGLAAIEQAALAHADALVVRVAALVGPTRTHALKRVQEAAARGEPCIVSGDPDRPFSYIHEQDCADICALALQGCLGTGILNCASPRVVTVRGYYEALARSAGVTVQVQGDGTPSASRAIDARRLHALVPDFIFRSL
jgi:nucleoside-diphosphate-sugar epimerase